MSDPRGVGFVAGGFLFFFGCSAFIRGFKLYRRKRKIEDTPSSKIRSMAIGPVEVSGTARIDIDLKSPVSGAKVVYYWYLIEELRGSGKNRRWVKLCEGNSCEYEFYIEDETGSAMVQPKGASFEIRNSTIYRNGDLPGGVIQILDDNGIKSTNLFGFSSELRCTEKWISPGENVYVLGTALSIAQTMKTERREIMVEKIQAAKASPEIMTALDRNRDGQVDAEEWEHARSFIELKVDQTMKAKFGDLSIGAHNDNEFLISEYSQAELLGRYRWRMIASIFGGPILSFLGFWLIWTILNGGTKW